MTTATRDGRLPRPRFEVRPAGYRVGVLDLGRDGLSTVPFSVARFSVPPGVATALDQHEAREIWLVQAGSGVLELDGQRTPVAAGDALYFDSFREHRLLNDGDETIDVTSIWW
jgi:mannose-6-phosphate isomerase-like protein (cupin superfamily)